jgi:hypothetical protein
VVLYTQREGETRHASISTCSSSYLYPTTDQVTYTRSTTLKRCCGRSHLLMSCVMHCSSLLTGGYYTKLQRGALQIKTGWIALMWDLLYTYRSDRANICQQSTSRCKTQQEAVWRAQYKDDRSCSTLDHPSYRGRLIVHAFYIIAWEPRKGRGCETHRLIQ